jgi:hypothetical protein
MAYTYTIFELTLAVPFPCPMLSLAPIGAVADVEVIEGQVPRNLPEATLKGQNWELAHRIFLFRGGSRAGRFLVEGGERITLERNPSAEESLICSFLLTTVIAVLLQQRGLLVLHANVVVTPRGAIAIAGTSGAGKSTTQAALLKQGSLMLTDDVTVLRSQPDGTVVALPGVPKMNLCEDAALKLGHDIKNLPRNPLQSLKVVIPVALGDSMAEPVTLKAIYLISRHSGDGLVVNQLKGIAKFVAMQDCIYGPQLTEELPELFSLLRAVTEQVDITTLQRPIRGCSLNKVMEEVLHG